MRLQEVFQLCNRERRRQMPSLRAVASEFAQHRELLPRFHGSRRDIQTNGFRHTDQRPHDVDVVLVLSDTGDALTVDFHVVDAEAGQRAEGGPPLPEVVDRDLHP